MSSDTVAIRLENLSKTFGRGKHKVEAVKNVNLEVQTGQVYGFLGPNGAGKTTAIRMILDLMRPKSGAAYIYGQHVRQNHDVLRRVGALVEGPAFYPYLTGRRNLEVQAMAHGMENIKQRIDTLLEQVDLVDRSKRRYRGYSLGMKQRLGLAAALLHDPELLILDEPTNGLDPAGIQEMRRFIRDLADKQGKTVFLSSHLLNEVEQVCDRVAIINNGEIVREGTVTSLLEGQSRYKIRATPFEKAQAVISPHWTVTPNGANAHAVIGAEAEHPGFIVEASMQDVPTLVRKLVENDIEIYEVSSVKQSLEEVFLTLTSTQDAK